MKFGRFLGRALGSLAVLSLAFVGGVTFQDLRAVRDPLTLRAAVNLIPVRLQNAWMTAARAQDGTYSPFDTYADVLTTLKHDYYGVALEPGMIPGGGEVGIGVLLTTDRAGKVVVSKVLPDGPAAKARLQKDDVVTAIDGKPTAGADDTAEAQKLIGAPGTPVTLTVQRKGSAPMTLTATRAPVLKEIDSTQMTYNGIRGMMGAVKDRYTRFMDPPAYKAMMDDNHGEFVGIGAVLGTNPATQVYIVRVIPNGPAMQYKVMAGDIISKVDGRSTLKMKDTDVVKIIRGEPNTKVTLTLLRKGGASPVVITIPRGVVQQEVVQHAMIDPAKKIGYVQLTVFNEESDIQLGEALADLQRQGMRGLVFDLRENPGGLLDVAQDVASRFIPSGPIVWTKSSNETMKTMDSLDVKPEQHNGYKRVPLVVLVNGNSASAAEIVSGAIKDTDAGVLVGEKTFGKGLVQSIIPLPDKSAIAVTIQHYYTAHKNDINHKGIQPNYPVAYTDATQRKIYAYLRAHPEAFFDKQDDTQLQKAISVLSEKMVARARP